VKENTEVPRLASSESKENSSEFPLSNAASAIYRDVAYLPGGGKVHGEPPFQKAIVTHKRAALLPKPVDI
jgi:hypothetical protein